MDGWMDKWKDGWTLNNITYYKIDIQKRTKTIPTF